MKKGIITFHNANNLGAVLQAYALQKKVSEIFKDDIVEIIDYENDYFKEKVPNTSIKGILKNIYYYIKNKGFNKFRKKYLILSPTCNKNTISYSNELYDTYICGSDQIWNLDCSKNDYNYFLKFADSNIKRISYAASLGNYVYSKEEKQKVFEQLKHFNKISIREKESLKEFDGLNLNVEVVPDPVFLLKKEEWMQLMPKRLTKKKYIFVYLIQEDINVMKSAYEYAKNNKCIIISNKKSLKFMLKNSPELFLSWIYYADAVFTNSFHGTAFALIFGKKLGADIALKNGNINNRVSEILKLTENEQCIISADNHDAKLPKDSDVMKKMRNTGIEYIKDI